MSIISHFLSYKDRLRSYHLHGLKSCGIKKISNILQTEYSIYKGETILKSKPYIANIDIGNVCNYKCRFCPTGEGRRGRETIIMSYDRFKDIFFRLHYDYFLILYLHIWGEPLLNNDLGKIIRLIKEKNVFCGFSTNLSLMTYEKAFEIVESGLDFMVLSLDAATEESYRKFRTGTFENVIRGLEYLIKARGKLKKSKPYLEWQFILFEHNRSELEMAKRLSVEYGVDNFTVLEPYVEDKTWIPLGKQDKSVYKHSSLRFCKRPWTHIAIQSDGGVSPCCWVYYKKDDFGNILDKDFDGIWNGGQYISAREILLNKDGTGIKNVCHLCSKTNVSPFASLRDKDGNA
ncbi:MAG: radical SAM protein [Candidatus Hydrogenedentota bacterium]